MDSLPQVILLQLPPRPTVSLSRGMALVLMTPPLLRSPPPRPPMPLSLRMSRSLLTRPMGNSQQPLHLQDHRMVTNPLRPVNLNPAQGVTTSPAWDMDRETTVISRYLGATPCSQSRHRHPILLPAIPLHSRLVMIRAVTLSRTPMGSRAAMDSRVAMVNKAAMGSSRPLVTPPPQTGSYSQAPSQYSQQSSSYGQQNVTLSSGSFRQDHPSSMGVYGQESGGFSGPGENPSMSGPDNRGRGRGGFDRGGMSRGGRGGGRGGMGSAGERGGFNKPGGAMDEGPDLDLGPPVDPDEDSDNSAIYVQGLNDNVTLDDLADFFKQCGVVKINKRTGQPMIHIYLDKETGKPKGNATVSYEDPPTAKAAVDWFDGKDFQGSKLKVSLARKKPPMNSNGGGGHAARRGQGDAAAAPRRSGRPRRPRGTHGSHGRPRRRQRRLSPKRAPGLPRKPIRRRKRPAPSWRLAVPQSGVWKPEFRLENRMQPV
uniref:RRM domain-containing protein n=1 Tax=Myotis myotis TaxID=51298 RepID=A0A7J8AMQ7_MYOMY|nr:hypothetical protein mMyoMyo1_008007 [Myotis myotis]